MIKRILVLTCVVGILFGMTIPAYAQNPPDWVRVALEALSVDVNHQVSVSQLTRWTWEQVNFPDTSLGCPRQGQVYSQVISPGYIVKLLYNGVEYDYRVALNGSVVFQCSQGANNAQVISPTVTPANQPGPQAFVPGTVVCTGSLAARLSAGMTAKSIATVSLNIRNQPGATAADSVAGLLPPGGVVSVIGGPSCANNATWWNITYQAVTGVSTTGWVAEGDNVEYWLEGVSGAPIAPVAPPDMSTFAPITTANVAQLRVLAQSSLTTTLAVLMPAPNPDAFLAQLPNLPVLHSNTTRQSLSLTLGHAGQNVRTLALAANVNQVSFLAATLEDDPSNGAQTLLYVWELADLNSSPSVTEWFGLALPFVANDIEFSSNGRWLAATSGMILAVDPNTPNGVWVWDVVTGTQVTALQLPTAANGIAFSPDARFMVVASPAADVHVFDTATWTQVAILQGAPALNGSDSLTFSPDGRLLVFGEQGGAAQVYDTATWSLLRTLTPAYEGAAAYVDFSADSSVLAVGIVHMSMQHPQNRAATITLWDVNSGVTLTTLPDFNDSLRAMAFRSNGRQLIAIGQQSWWSWGVQ